MPPPSTPLHFTATWPDASPSVNTAPHVFTSDLPIPSRSASPTFHHSIPYSSGTALDYELYIIE
ncbi:hypothetical protein PISMIDRAFT_13846 [Pisolithus microcarpus 441]|uniref:Uncharacterized protein n=1 Tax=Pisolithus microcarpus 441 TaxID=765257 RepID=A0A0C9YZ44_9AGAM|nr:hypothetical protein PISMIDRAFT_13846 [Pisolithus microcarpus 441]